MLALTCYKTSHHPLCHLAREVFIRRRVLDGPAMGSSRSLQSSSWKSEGLFNGEYLVVRIGKIAITSAASFVLVAKIFIWSAGSSHGGVEI